MSHARGAWLPPQQPAWVPTPRLSRIIVRLARQRQPQLRDPGLPQLRYALRRYSRQVLIVSIGDLLLDIAIVPAGQLQPDDDSPATITLGGGGQAANFCAWTASLGDPARLVARVGDDETGRRLVADLEG